jgi:hypothetical protein
MKKSEFDAGSPSDAKWWRWNSRRGVISWSQSEDKEAGRSRSAVKPNPYGRRNPRYDGNHGRAVTARGGVVMNLRTAGFPTGCERRAKVVQR